MRGTIRHAKSERIVVESRGSSPDALGQNLAPWAPLCTLWAYRDARTGSEFVAGGAQQAELTVRFQVAMRPDITTGMRVRWSGKLHDIKAVVPTGRDLDLITVEGTGDGR